MIENRFENRLDKSNVKFNTLNPVWDNEKECGLNVFEMMDLLNKYDKEYNMCHNDVLRLEKENEQLKERNNRQYNKLNELWQIIEEENWETLIAMKKQLKEDEEQLQREWRSINE